MKIATEKQCWELWPSTLEKDLNRKLIIFVLLHECNDSTDFNFFKVKCRLLTPKVFSSATIDYHVLLGKNPENQFYTRVKSLSKQSKPKRQSENWLFQNKMSNLDSFVPP